MSVGECCDAMSAGSLRLCWRSCWGVRARACMLSSLFLSSFLSRSVCPFFLCLRPGAVCPLLLLALLLVFRLPFLVMCVWFDITAPSYLHHSYCLILVGCAFIVRNYVTVMLLLLLLLCSAFGSLSYLCIIAFMFLYMVAGLGFLILVLC